MVVSKVDCQTAKFKFPGKFSRYTVVDSSLIFIPVHEAFRLRELPALSDNEGEYNVEELPVVQSLDVVGYQVTLNLCTCCIQCERAVNTCHNDKSGNCVLYMYNSMPCKSAQSQGLVNAKA